MLDYLVVGLGNPGRQYLHTRHNAGFLLIDRLIDRYGASLSPDSGRFVLWTAETERSRLFLMKPLTYMNLSGDAVKPLLAKLSIPLERVLIAYDDISLALGAIRVRASGSDGGQKGIRHIIQCLDTRDVPRIRIGIDSDLRGGLPLPDFVLTDFTDDEVPLIRKALDDAVDACRLWMEEGLTSVMAAYNGRARKHATGREVSTASGPAMEEKSE
ncbi:MAG: aminoacyl-tRNA hydrolase [Acidobacteriota bacterium]|nr:aminoacyl-tRNA hydrolase [Acidobacteriota bacterium]